MGVEEQFWQDMKEYGALDCVDLTFHGKNYQLVSDSQTKSFLLYETDRLEGDDIMLKEFYSLADMLDESQIDGCSIREILQQIEMKDYFWH